MTASRRRPVQDPAAGGAQSEGPAPDDLSGREGPDAPHAVVLASWCGTAAFALTAIAAVFLGRTADVVAFVVAVALFGAGCGAFGWAYVRAVTRSRRHEISVNGLFFLAGGSAPSQVRRQLLGSFAAQVLVAVATAAARPYTSLAAGTLVPLYGLGLCGLWAARHGVFPARRPRPKSASGSPGDPR